MGQLLIDQGVQRSEIRFTDDSPQVSAGLVDQHAGWGEVHIVQGGGGPALGIEDDLEGQPVLRCVVD
ncbi:hypothetical protein [Cupriavidus basilensis]